jgi:hypothetical protein
MSKKIKETAGEELNAEDLAGVAGGLGISVTIPDALLGASTAAVGTVKSVKGRLRRHRHGHAKPATSAAALGITATVTPTVTPGIASPVATRVPGTAPALTSILKK